MDLATRSPSKPLGAKPMAARLREARIRAGMTPIDAARYLKVTRKTIYDWERGVSVPRADRFERAMEVYGGAVPV